MKVLAFLTDGFEYYVLSYINKYLNVGGTYV